MRDWNVEPLRDPCGQLAREQVRIAVGSCAGIRDRGQHARQRWVGILIRGDLVYRPTARRGLARSARLVCRDAVQGRGQPWAAARGLGHRRLLPGAGLWNAKAGTWLTLTRGTPAPRNTAETG